MKYLKRTKARYTKSFGNSEKILNGQVAYNQYGGYFTPLSSRKRPAVQKILKGKVHEPETIAFMMKNCKKGDIIHAGTFFGDFLPALSGSVDKSSKIWAFEPNPENYQCARITIMINQLKNVELYNCGLGEKNARSQMLIETDTGVPLGGASAILKEEQNTGKTTEVEIKRIDDIIPDNRTISIIQLDVEGYEKEALIGGLKTINRCKPLLILEDNNEIINSDWFDKHIKSSGDEINRIIHGNTVLTIKSNHNIR
jgi:FkbM family methyltransferase